jgi:hypothetical protein
MKCPHCNTAFAEAFVPSTLADLPEVKSRTGQFLAPRIMWNASHQRCPECHETIIFLSQLPFSRSMAPNQPGSIQQHLVKSFMAYPHAPTRPIPPEVATPYREDFSEACKVLGESPKASAALSRRCLQAILRDQAGTKSKDLFDQIEEVINSGKVPAHIQKSLHAVRQIGNFAAHTMKSTTTGAILDVEPGEAEWNLDVLESLFDHYFVQPALTAKRTAELNTKLKAAGKPELP